MKNILTLFIAFILLASVLFISGDVRNVNAQTIGNNLVSQLPASDAVATMNLKKLFSDVIPQVLASQPAKLAELNAKIDEIKAKTGIDLRQFEQAAVGMTFKPGDRSGKIEAEPLILLRGNFNAAGLLAVGKIAANGKFRQEQIGGKTVTIFSIPESPRPTVKQAAEPGMTVEEKIVQPISGEFAVYAVDANTLAGGKPAHVRSVLTNTTVNNRVAANLIDLVNRNPNAVMSFAGNVPPAAKTSLGMDNDQIGRVVGSLRQIFGSLDMNDGAASLTLVARAGAPAQAQELEETLIGLQMLGKGFLGGKTDDKSQAIFQAVDNLKISRSQADVQLQTSLSPIELGALAKKIK